MAERLSIYCHISERIGGNTSSSGGWLVGVDDQSDGDGGLGRSGVGEVLGSLLLRLTSRSAICWLDRYSHLATLTATLFSPHHSVASDTTAGF